MSLLDRLAPERRRPATEAPPDRPAASARGAAPLVTSLSGNQCSGNQGLHFTLIGLASLAAWCTAATALATTPPERACGPRPSVYVGAIRGATDLADSENVRQLGGLPNTGYYLTSYALAVTPGLREKLSAVRSNFVSRRGIIEVGTNPAQMSDVASRFGQAIDQTHGWTWGDQKGATWPADIEAAGWQPDVALLNPFGMGAEGTGDRYYQMNLLALADVKRASPGIRHVLPFATPNARPLRAEDHDLNWSDPAWKESVALAEAAGGLGLDTPANYFVHGREEAYRALVAQEIRWANAHGLVSVVLISPYAIGAGGSNGADGDFMQATQQEVAYLHKAGADPTVYVAANYAEAPAAVTPGRDTDANSIDAVALWLAQNAITTRFPSSWQSASCG